MYAYVRLWPASHCCYCLSVQPLVLQLQLGACWPGLAHFHIPFRWVVLQCSAPPNARTLSPTHFGSIRCFSGDCWWPSDASLNSAFCALSPCPMRCWVRLPLQMIEAGTRLSCAQLAVDVSDLFEHIWAHSRPPPDFCCLHGPHFLHVK